MTRSLNRPLSRSRSTRSCHFPWRHSFLNYKKPRTAAALVIAAWLISCVLTVARPFPIRRPSRLSAFRMVRSGDAAGQGLPFYAQRNRERTDKPALFRTLFEPWNYTDEGFSLRWDPLDDQRYALRWHDPGGNRDKHSPTTMLGANVLAIEALILFPTTPRPGGLATTGFFRSGRQEYFTWPIWELQLSTDGLRSLLALGDLYREKPDRKALLARGIVEIYRSERVAPNQWYKNFSPAIPA